MDCLQWMTCLTQKLQAAFEKRLLFVGLQGSCQRGEATAQSDIDVVVLLDTVCLRELSLYRSILAEMPWNERACGFICGKEEFTHWPKHEIFRFCQDTRTFYGNLEQLAPSITQADIQESLRIGAANLYHEVCHLYLYGNGSAESLKGAYKNAFFLLQIWYYLVFGKYVQTRRELLPLLHDPEAELLSRIICWDEQTQERSEHPERWFESLLNWSGRVLTDEGAK